MYEFACMYHIFAGLAKPWFIICDMLSFEPRHEKTGFLHMRKQRRRSASR